MQKPQIVVCATAYHPFVGGAEIAIQEVARRLSGQFDFFILTARMSRALPRREIRPEAAIVRLGLGTRFDKWLLLFLIPMYVIGHWPLAIGQNKKPSGFLFWGMDISQGSLGAALAKTLCPRIPFVLTVQYGESEDYLTHGRFGLIGFAFRRMLARADFVTAISSYLFKIARAQGFCGPGAVIHNGADIATSQNTNNKFPTKHKTQNPQRETIITVSRLVKKNGVDLLIRAFAEVKKEMPDALLYVVGDGPEKNALEKLADEVGVRDAVIFFGGIAHDALPQYLHHADVFVRASRSEGMGVAFVEAMAAGLPVVGTAVGGIPDIIEDGKTGLFARPDDPRDLAEKILHLFADQRLAVDLAAAGKEKAVRVFDWDGIARAYTAVFQQEAEAKKRVVIATGLFPPEIGGPATYSALLIDGLPLRGIGLCVVPFRSVRRFPKIIRHFAYFWKIVFAGRGSDIIFAQDPVSTGLPVLFASRLMRKKFLLKIVGDYAWEQFQQRQRPMANSQWRDLSLEEFQKGRCDLMTELRRTIQKLVARRAARIIVPSRYLKGIVLQWGVRKENISVIYNAFVPPGTLPSKADARAVLGISSDIFFIVSAGRLVPWKGFGELILAMAAIRKDIPQARLVIIGSGPDQGALRKKIEEEQVGDMASLAGAVSHEKMLEYLRAADLFVLNSSYEGFSHTLLEAMAMEVSVMASDVGGNSEIITDSVNGRLYHRRDATALAEGIVRLWQDAAARERFAKEAKIVLRRFGREALLASTAETVFSL